MGKPAGKTYDKFREKFFKINEKLGKKQYIIPYLMSSHPGSTLDSAIELAEYLRDINYQPEQVQDFIQLLEHYQQLCFTQDSTH